MQLPYCVIVLLLTNECKSAAAQYTNIVIILRLRSKVFQENKLRLYYHSVSLYLSLMSELKAF